MEVRHPPVSSKRTWVWELARLRFAEAATMFTVPEPSPRPKMLELGPRLISTASISMGSTGTRPLVAKPEREMLAAPMPRTRLADSRSDMAVSATRPLRSISKGR
jgi:hypothetical protein